MLRISNHAMHRILQRLPIKYANQVDDRIKDNIVSAYKNNKYLYVLTAHGNIPGGIKVNPHISEKAQRGAIQHYMKKNLWVFGDKLQLITIVNKGGFSHTDYIKKFELTKITTREALKLLFPHSLNNG